MLEAQRRAALNYSAEFVMYLQEQLQIQIDMKVALRFTPDKPLEFAQQEAAIHAKIELYRGLIDANINPNTRTLEI